MDKIHSYSEKSRQLNCKEFGNNQVQLNKDQTHLKQLQNLDLNVADCNQQKKACREVQDCLENYEIIWR